MKKKVEDILKKEMAIEHDLSDRVLEIKKIIRSAETEDIKIESIKSILAELTQEIIDAKVSAMFEKRTGLLSAGAGEEILARELSLAQRQRTSFGLILLDVDFLKTINDKFGHVVGTKVIVELAKIIKKVIRRSDVAVRYGGDEFMIILRGKNACETGMVIQRIKSQVKEAVVDGAKISVSTGAICVAGEEFKNIQEVIQAADAVLYKAKEERINPNL